MAEKKHESSGFTVTDRRLFTSDGDLRVEGAEPTEEPKPAPAAEPAAPTAKADVSPIDAGDGNAMRDMPPPPTPAEQDAQAAAYRQSSKDVDSQVELSGRSAKEFEVSFERFLASLYMTAMMQLGLMHEQGGQPRVDIIGARQTIDTMSLIQDKTKGNLSPVEQ